MYTIVCVTCQLLLLVGPLPVVAFSSSKTTTPATTTIPKWLMDRLAKYDLQVHDFPITGRGLQTTRDRAAGDVILQVPEADAVTVSSLLTQFPILEQAATVAASSLASNEQDNKHATKQLLTDEQVLAAGLLLLREQQDPYAISLPPQYSVLQMPQELLSTLPLAYQKLIQAYRDHVENLRVSLLENFSSLRRVDSHDNDVNNNHANKDDNQIKSLLSNNPQHFLWAFATVRSRCVGMDGDSDDDRVRTGGKGEIRVMLPGFDLLNHQFGAQTMPSFVSDHDGHGKYYVVRSNQAYKRNDQVFISYSDVRDNLKMLMTYGFCLDNNPNRLVTFDVQELLEACAAARPNYFASPTTLNQIWSLLRQLNKQRELYVWDGTTRQPHPSLSTAIEMMTQLETQFLSENEKDVSFGQDVLAALIAARKQELAQRKRMLDEESLKQLLKESWASMKNSIKVLIEQEEHYLTETADSNSSRDCSATMDIQ